MVRGVKKLFLVRGVVLAVGLAASAGCGSSSSSSSPGDSGTDGGGATITVDPRDAGPSGVVPPPANMDTTAIDTSTMPAQTWSWVPVQGTMCRDGSPTGIALNLNPNSKQLVIYLEGGGACFNATTCLGNPACFTPPAVTADGGASGADGGVGAADGAAAPPPCAGFVTFDSRLGGAAGSGGIFNRADAANPVKDWNFVYVPFCTGDLHGGLNTDATVSGVAGKQQFVGYANMQRDLARLVPTFPNLTKVLLTGISAGGFGAAINYPQTANAFAPVPVYSLDDSGPPMSDPYLASCLQSEQATLWGLDKTLLVNCGPDCADHSNYSIDAVIHTVREYPNIPFGLIEDTDDNTITSFYGYGANNCAATFIPTAVTGPQFTAGLLDERKKLAAAGVHNVASYIFQDTRHTTLAAQYFDTQTAGGGDAGPKVKLTDWVTTLVNDGTVTNVGP